MGVGLLGWEHQPGKLRLGGLVIGTLGQVELVYIGTNKELWFLLKIVITRLVP